MDQTPAPVQEILEFEFYIIQPPQANRGEFVVMMRIDPAIPVFEIGEVTKIQRIISHQFP